jgi:ADP-ribose pyrophosphatase YjhB (NUDIX family)
MADPQFCQACATPLEHIELAEDGGPKSRLRCPACGWTHWNNPTPVLAAIIEYRGQVLLARNAAWPHKMYALITGFMEAGETPQEGIAREIKEETNLDASELNLVGVYDFQRMNQVIIASTNWARFNAGPPARATRWRTGCARAGTSPGSPNGRNPPLRIRLDFQGLSRWPSKFTKSSTLEASTARCRYSRRRSRSTTCKAASC